MVEDESVITKWYNDRSIFITGGNGFMGKVLVEKLLYSCSGIKHIYLLMRFKKGKTVAERLQEMWNLPLFDRLRKSQPNAFSKLVPVIGEMGVENLGLSTTDEELLIENVHVVFHCAATLRMTEKLKTAINQNVAGTARMLELAKKMKHLKAFLYYSTTYCSADLDVFEEKIYNSPVDPKDVIKISTWMNDEALEKATPAIIKPHPNTYTYTKRVSENLVASEADNLSVCIIRPSIVIPAWKEPIEGWVDSFNGPMGLVIAVGEGILRSVYCKRDYHSDCIPVDTAICVSIIAAQRLGSAAVKPKEVPVYNLTQHELFPTTWGEVLDMGREVSMDCPLEQQVWYPDSNIRSNLYVHYIFCVLYHWIPAFIIDGFLTIFRQKTFMIKLQKRIHGGLELLQFFALRQWKFPAKNFLSLKETMTEADLKVLPVDISVGDPKQYFLKALLGGRQYILKEDPSTIPRCQVKQKILYVIHKACIYGFYAWTIYLLVSYSKIMRMILTMICDLIGSLPVMAIL